VFRVGRELPKRGLPTAAATSFRDRAAQERPRSRVVARRKRHNPDAMSVYYGYSCSASPYVVARYACRCGRNHMQHGAVQVSKLPPGWHETSDSAAQPEPECPRCHNKTVARRKASA
jgi:hypothetical protein